MLINLFNNYNKSSFLGNFVLGLKFYWLFVQLSTEMPGTRLKINAIEKVCCFCNSIYINIEDKRKGASQWSAVEEILCRLIQVLQHVFMIWTNAVRGVHSEADFHQSVIPEVAIVIHTLFWAKLSQRAI